MLPRIFAALAVFVCLVAPVAVHAQGDYLDVYIANVKPEKIADFEALAKKMVDANRRYNGDRWLAMESLYGQGYTYVFISNRQDYADTDKASAAFLGALAKAYGQDGAEKMLHAWDSCLLSSRSELRKRRRDLSRKMPEGADYVKFVGESRLLRTTEVHIRPGRVADFEALMKDVKTAGEQAANTQPLLVSQVIEGGNGTIFYVTSLRPSLGGFDKNPATREILGDEGYKKFLQVSADVVEGTDSSIYRFSAELSFMPQEVMAAAPDFWQPKPDVAHTAKPKASPVQPAAQITKQ